MSSLAFLLIVFSALMHALWNLLVKRSRDKTVFIWWMFVVSGSLLNLLVGFFFPSLPPLRLEVVLLAASGGACFVLYHLFNGVAYRDGDLSLAYPLSQTSMVYVPIWGTWLLGERLSPLGAGGVALILLGAYCVQLRSLRSDEVLRPFRSLGELPVRAALAAGLVYSVGAIIDKTGVTLYPPLQFTWLLVMCMFLIMTVNLMRPRFRGRILQEWHASRRLILLSGPVMMGSFLSFRYGLQMAPVSYAVPVRQVSLLFGVLLGVLFLGERYGRIRFVSALLIMAGAVLIRLS